MRASTCAEVRADAPELALDVLAGDRRAAVLAHLEHCAACRAEVDDLIRAVDVLITSLPSAPPPPGFADRVRGAMIGPPMESPAAAIASSVLSAATTPSEVSGRPLGTRRDSTRPSRRGRRLVAIGVAAVSALAVSGGAFAWNATRSRSPAPFAVPSGATQTRALVGASGATGSVTLSPDDPTWISMRMTTDDRNKTYTCDVILLDGTTHRVGALTVHSGGGGWSATVPFAADQIAVVRVVDPDGTTVATAHFT